MQPVRALGRWVRRASLIGAVLGGAAFAWSRISPRPGVRVINWLFTLTDTGEVKGMSATGVKGRMDLAYGSGPDEFLDVWSPAGATEPLPAVLWVHGGGWVGGGKSQPAPYLRLLAQHGYVGVGIDYSLAPGRRFPVPVRQASQALTWMQAHADELGIDPSRIVLAGDSAGAHIAAQVALIATDPQYAELIGIAPVLDTDQLRGVLLHCGPYDPPASMSSTGFGGWLVRTLGWAYLGTKDFTDPRVEQASIVKHATSAFPPALISGGDDDPLTKQGRALADRLVELGVDHEAHFHAGLNHEFQFDLTRPEARQVLDATVDFLARVTHR